MLWMLGSRSGVEFLAWTEFREKALGSEEHWGGGLHAGLQQVESRLCAYLPQIALDFSLGYTALAFVVSCSEPRRVGPLAPPTAARGLSRAPMGLYVLAPQRLRQAIVGCPEREEAGALHFHRNAHTGQPFFCDPNLEFALQGDLGNLHYHPPGLFERLRSALSALASGEGES